MKKALILTMCASLLGGCVAYEHRTLVPGVTPVTRDEVVTMTRGGFSDGAILDRIHKDGVAARPSADDIVFMKQEGVSSAVMNAMLSAPVTQPRAPQEHSTVVYDPEPAILVGIGALLGYAIGRSHRHHVHHVHTAWCRH
jgi:hypothetical protein